MRTVHWLFVVSAALFVSGIGFVVAAGRTTQQAPPVQRLVTPVASVRQIMNGITGPAAAVVFASVGTVISYEGVRETVPRTDAEWQAVGDSAAALVESGNLLMMGSRAADNGDWITISQAMIEASKVALKAIEAKDAEALLFSGEAINDSCDNCHQRYQR
jgi:hypothetical protein